ncbi:MAG: methyl-accepting chemotaxis protein [Bdellovibrionia bacterium]
MKISIKRTIGTVISAAFGGIIATMILSSVLSIQQLNKISRENVRFAEAWLPAVSKIGQISHDITDFRRLHLEMLESLDEKTANTYAEDIDSVGQSLFIYIKGIDSLVTTEKDRKTFERFSAAWEAASAEHIKVLEQFKAKHPDQAKALLSGKALESYKAAQDALQELASSQLDGGIAGSAHIVSLCRSAGLLIWIVLGFAAVGACVAAFLISRWTRKRLEQISVLLDEKAGSMGKISAQLLKTGKGLIESSSLSNHALSRAAASSEQISAMAGKTSDYARTSKESALTSQSSVDQLSQMVRALTANLKEVGQKSGLINERVKAGNDEVSKVIEMIREIEQKTKVINDIVFQTRLLSFNASVEAARAGEHGKGFAVVAEEIGNLASMSGKAAGEISELLGSRIVQVSDIVERTQTGVAQLVSDSQQSVDQGTSLVKNLTPVLETVINHVGGMVSVAEQIALASEEQVKGIVEIKQSISDIQTTAQATENAATESEGISKDLFDHVESMGDAVHSLNQLVSGKKKEAAVSVSEPEPPMSQPLAA